MHKPRVFLIRSTAFICAALLITTVGLWKTRGGSEPVVRNKSARWTHVAALYTPGELSDNLRTHYFLSIAKTLQSLHFRVEFLLPRECNPKCNNNYIRTISSTASIKLDFEHLSLSTLPLLMQEISIGKRKAPLIFLATGSSTPQFSGIGKNLNIFLRTTTTSSHMTLSPNVLGSFDIILLEDSLAQKQFLLEAQPVMDLLLRRAQPVPQAEILSPPFLNSSFEVKLSQIVNRALVGKAFKKFTVDTLRRYRSLPSSQQSAAKTAQKGAVIVETSSHWAFEYVCRNVIYHLGAHWGLLVFHGSNNEAFVRAALRGIPNVQFRRLTVSLNAIGDYNEMMKTEGFWNQIRFDKVLLFQTDSVLLHGKIGKYLKYDYIGAPWDPKDNVAVRIALASGTLNSTVGNGGLSLRSVGAMRDIVKVFSSRAQPKEQEDVFFAKYLPQTGYRLGTVEDATTFSVEVDVFAGKDASKLGIFALHAPWYYMPPDRYLPLLKSSVPSWTSQILSSF